MKDTGESTATSMTITDVPTSQPISNRRSFPLLSCLSLSGAAALAIACVFLRVFAAILDAAGASTPWLPSAMMIVALVGALRGESPVMWVLACVANAAALAYWLRIGGFSYFGGV